MNTGPYIKTIGKAFLIAFGLICLARFTVYGEWFAGILGAVYAFAVADAWGVFDE